MDEKTVCGYSMLLRSGSQLVADDERQRRTFGAMLHSSLLVP